MRRQGILRDRNSGGAIWASTQYSQATCFCLQSKLAQVGESSNISGGLQDSPEERVYPPRSRNPSSAFKTSARSRSSIFIAFFATGGTLTLGWARAVTGVTLPCVQAYFAAVSSGEHCEALAGEPSFAVACSRSNTCGSKPRGRRLHQRSISDLEDTPWVADPSDEEPPGAMAFPASSAFLISEAQASEVESSIVASNLLT